MTNLERFKGIFVNDKPKKIKRPAANAVVHFDDRFQVNGTVFSHNGKCWKSKGAL